MRLFLGIEVPSEAARALAAAGPACWAGTGCEAEGGAGGREPPRWTAAGDLHLTLRFLGELERAGHAPWPTGADGSPTHGLPPDLAPELERACARLAAFAAGSRPAPLSLDRLGVFPGRGRRARVLWVGPGELPPAWAGLAAAAEAEARALGFPPGRATWRPHVTLARPRPREAAAAASLAGRPLPTPVALPCAAICLFSNRGAVEGAAPRYRVEHRAPVPD